MKYKTFYQKVNPIYTACSFVKDKKDKIGKEFDKLYPYLFENFPQVFESGDNTANFKSILRAIYNYYYDNKHEAEYQKECF